MQRFDVVVQASGMRKREAAAMEAVRVVQRLADRQAADAMNGNRYG